MEGVLAAEDSDVDRSMDLLKHQFFPFIGNTTNLARMMMILFLYGSGDEFCFGFKVEEKEKKSLFL